MNILKYKKIYLSISAFLVGLAIAMIISFGFNFGVDFKGGTIYEVQYTKNTPNIEDVKKAAINAGAKTVSVQKLGKNNFVIKTAILDQDKVANWKDTLDKKLDFNNKSSFEEVQFKTISPSISSEFINKSIWAIILVSIIIILFIGYVFSGVSYPVSSYKYGLIAIIALLHDIIIPTGFFALLGYYFVEYQIDVLFVTAVLAILGYSVNDTIVVFDRIRENLKSEGKKVKGKEFEKVVEKSLHQTIRRSIFTSLTTIIVIGFLYFMGGENTKSFALILGLGVIAGTYSSIFLASPLLLIVEKYWKSNNENKKDRSEMTEDEIIEELTRI